MTERIFVATDLSKGDDEVLRTAHARALATGGDVAVCHVHADVAISDARLRMQLAERVSSHMPDLYPELLIEYGIGSGAVLRRAEDWSADLIVVGSRVAQQVVRHAHCPVLVARHATKSGVVVVATDLSDPAMPAIVAGRDEARRRGAKLVVVHAIEFGSVGVTIEEIALDIARPNASWNTDERLRARSLALLRRAVTSCGAEADTLVLDGPPGPAVLRVADALDAELVVIGTRGRTGIARVALGSTADRIVRAAARPVLAVRLASS